MCQNISKDNIYYSKIYCNSDLIIKILYILNRCIPIVLTFGFITHTIVTHLDILQNFAITCFASFLVSVITYFPDFLVSAITRFVSLLVFTVTRFADLLVSTVIRFAKLTILLVSSINCFIITFAYLFVFLIFSLPCFASSAISTLSNMSWLSRPSSNLLYLL